MAPSTAATAHESPLPLPGADFDPATPHDTHDDAPPCPFCRIATVYAPYDPADPPHASSVALRPDASAPDPATFVVLSTPLLLGFLDIMPLSTGHVLLCPRRHRPKLTDATPAEAAAMGLHLRVLSAAVARATGVQSWNVVQNNGAAAAQVVPHAHFHIIPRPELRDRDRERFTSTMFGRGQREDLDEEEAAGLAEAIRAAVAEVLLRGAEEEEDEGDGKPKL